MNDTARVTTSGGQIDSQKVAELIESSLAVTAWNRKQLKDSNTTKKAAARAAEGIQASE